MATRKTKAKTRAKKATPRATPKAAVRTVDFSDEESVEAAMAEALGVDASRLVINHAKNYESFGTGDYYLVEMGSQEYYVAENEDSAHELALAVVKQDLESEPEIFNQSFIESHIDTDRLRRDLQSDTEESIRDSLSSLSERELVKEAERAGIDLPEEDEDGEREIDTDAIIEKLAEHQTEEQLRDPMQYLEDIFGREEAVKKAIEIAGIDINAAADEAVSADGPGHFLASYDGNINDGPGGIVYWRHN